MKFYLALLLMGLLTQNFVLSKFLGICPFLGVSKKLDTSAGMSAAVVLVMVLATAVTWPINVFLENNDLAYLQTIVFILVIAAPAFIAFSESGPGSKHAAIVISLVAGLAVGCMAQRTRLCMVGATRDLVLFGEKKLFVGFVAIFVAALIGNIVTKNFNLGFEQIGKVAHSDHVWNFLGLYLAGFGCVLLGGCPLRQLILAGEGNGDSAITVLGLTVGAAFSHNFGLAGAAASKAEDGTINPGGVGTNGRIAVIIGIVVVLVIAVLNTFMKKKEAK